MTVMYSCNNLIYVIASMYVEYMVLIKFHIMIHLESYLNTVVDDEY